MQRDRSFKIRSGAHVCDFHLHNKVPGDEEFKLAAFGLPESVAYGGDPSAKPRRWWLWGSLAGGAFLALAAVLDWLRRRAKR